MMPAAGVTWAICAGATAGVIVRPWRLPEWTWAMLGAALLVATGLVPARAAAGAVAKGADVYLFLIGMMLLSETARAEGVFDWVAGAAAQAAGGSRLRLFLLVYAAGTIVTAFLSNDATAVVLTPAVYAAARRAEADPLPLLFACALVANAASFVLPISNPANIVLYCGHMPGLARWLGAFAWPSAVSILTTGAALLLAERRRIAGTCARDVDRPPLARGGRVAFCGIALTAAMLLLVSARNGALGLPTALAGAATLLGVSVPARRLSLVPLARIAWGVLPLVAGLFVLVEALDRTGATAALAEMLRDAARNPAGGAIAATAVAFACNLTNNLPAGLIAGAAAAQARSPAAIVDGLLIGVDLGPILSVTGSLATILWLQAIRREGEDVTFRRFLKVGLFVMPVSLAATLGTWLALR